MEHVTTTKPEKPVNAAALRLSRTPGDMAKAVLVLLVPVAALFAAYVFFFGGNNVIAIDPSGDYGAARAAKQFTVVEPQSLSSDWKPVSSSYSNGVLRVGYVAPSGAGIQLVESKQNLISSEVGSTQNVAKAVDAGGLTWGQLSTTGKSINALVNSDTGRTVIIKGRAGFDELETFAASLK